MSPFSPIPRRNSRFLGGFTITELAVAVAVFSLMMAMVAQLLGSASALVSSGNKRTDADAQARGMLDRMAIDFGQIIKRADVSYYLKDSTNLQAGNDQMAFFSAVPGYVSSSGSPLSLVAYRINPGTMSAERLGTGLQWNGSTGSGSPIVFLPQTIASVWPQATNSNSDSNYETIAPSVFRFEYYYLLKGQTLSDGTPEPSILSTTPWDTRIPGHTSDNGLIDVAAIGVAIAVIDPASRAIVSNGQLSNLASQMQDFSSSMAPGQIEGVWKAVIEASSLPRTASQGIRAYSRMFYLSTQDP